MKRTNPLLFSTRILALLLLSITVACSGIANADIEDAALVIATSVTSENEITRASETPQVPTSTLPSLAKSSICSPLKDHDLTRIESYVSNPFAFPEGSNLETGHHGVDFSYYRKDGVGGPIDGSPIQAVLSGRVAGLGIDRLPYGNMVVIETSFDFIPSKVAEAFDLESGDSLYLLYAHMLEEPDFRIGQEVDCGQSLGLVGGSGFSGNPHLHLETRVGPSGFDLPTMAFYDTLASPAEQEAYQSWRFAGPFELHNPLILLNFSENSHGEQ